MLRGSDAPSTRPGRRARGALAGSLGAFVLVAAGCSSSGYQYVKSSNDGVYFKVPDSWGLIEVKPSDDGPTDRPEPLDLSQGPSPWTVVFDAAAEPSIDHFGEEAPASPVGLARVVPISPGARDTLTLAALRSLALGDGTDPLQLISEGDPSIEAISYEDINGSDGLRGSRIVFNQRLADGTWITVDHTALVDGATEHLYLFQVKCSATCFKANQSQIDDIADSWRVTTKGR